MKRDTISNTIAFTLLGLCFLVSLGRVVLLQMRERDPDRKLLRIAHSHLELGVREAFDEVIALYMATHPGVAIEQMAVPERVYKVWLDTKLFGGNVPDIVQYIHGNVEEGHLVSFFMPLSDLVAEPNPYNEGTPLEGVPWKDTFFDGLGDLPSFVPMHSNHFGIPTTVLTFRAYYNAGMMKALTGSPTPPATFDQLMELLATVDRHNEVAEERIIAFAGSKANAPTLLGLAFGNQTQKLKTRLEPTNELQVHGADVAVAYLNDQWGLYDSEIRSGLEIVKAIADRMSPGFMQLNRDDGLFQFVQERALMVVSGSYDAESIRLQAPFAVGAFRIPLPATDHPKYGSHVLGRQSEAGVGAQSAYSIFIGSERLPEAVDFLRFLGSQEGNRIFSRRSGWLPAVLGITPPEALKVFKPVDDGYPSGFTLSMGPNLQRLYETNLYHLLGPEGTVDRFLGVVESGFREGVRADLERMVDRVLARVPVYDTLLAAMWEKVDSSPDDPDGVTEKISSLMETVTYQEETTYWRAHELGVHTGDMGIAHGP
jgi:raffinose/stachyose/melibiose transport system substrate-binding protein